MLKANEFLAWMVGGFLTLAALAGSAGLALLAIRWFLSLVKGGF